MYFLRVISLIFVVILKPFIACAEVQYVSLGQDCEVSIQLNHFQLRNKAYPLEWMASINFGGIIRVFETDFEYFLDPAHLEYRQRSIHNTYYDFGYNHFFPLENHIINDSQEEERVVLNYLDYLPEVALVQNKRIHRLQKLLKSNTTVVFIRTHSNPEEAQLFMMMIKRKYPNLKAVLVVVHDRADLIDNWQIPHVLSFYATQKKDHSQFWSDTEWHHILNLTQNYLIMNNLQ